MLASGAAQLPPHTLPICRRIGFSLTNVNSPSTPVVVTCGTISDPACPPFANGYLADSRITALTTAERNELFPTGTQADYKLVTGLVAPAQLYTITLWGINDVNTSGVASTPSAEVATVGECMWCPGVGVSSAECTRVLRGALCLA